jgi:O-antigen/teichoic acid export membrane protein
MTDAARRINRTVDRYRSLARNAVILFALRFLQRLLRLVVLYFVVRALSKNAFGEYQFILSCSALMVVFTLPGLNNAVMQSVARGFSGVYRKAVPRALAASVIGSVVLAALGVQHRGAGELGLGFFLAAVLFPLAYGLEQWRAVRTGREDFAAVFRIDGFAVAVLAVLMIAGVTWLPGHLLVPLAVLLGVQTALNTLMTASTLRSMPKETPVEEGSLRYGARTTIYTAFNTAANQIDKLLLFYFLSPTALATFYAAERIPELTKGVVQDVSSVMAPRFAKSARYTAGLDRKLRWIGLGTGAAILVAAFVILPWLVSLVFGNRYDDAVPFAQALMCSIAIGNTATLRYRYIASKLDEASSRFVNITMSLTRIAASLVLVPLYGILGAVISAFIYRVATLIIVQIVIKKRYLDTTPGSD